MRERLYEAITKYHNQGFNIIPVGYYKFVEIALYALSDPQTSAKLRAAWGEDFLSELRNFLKAPTFSSVIREQINTNFSYLREPPSLFKVTGKRTGESKNAYEVYYKEKQTKEEVTKIANSYAHLASGVAILLGEVSNISAVDFDDKEELIALLNANGFACDESNLEEVLLQAFPQNAIVKTFRGYHIYFKYDPTIPNRKGLRDYKRIDVKAKDGYVLAPPSVAGIEVEERKVRVVEYTFLRELDEETKNSPLPDWFLNILKSSERGEEATTAPIHPTTTVFTSSNLKEFLVQHLTPFWKRGFRHFLSFTLAGLLRRGGVKESDALDIISTICDITQDEEKKARLYNVKYEYSLPLEGDRVCAGAKKFYEVALQAGMSGEVAKLIINTVYGFKPSVDVLGWFQDYVGLATKVAALLRNDWVFNEYDKTYYIFNRSQQVWEEVKESTAFHYVTQATLQLRSEIEEILKMQSIEFNNKVWACLNKLANSNFIKNNIFYTVKVLLTINHPLPHIPPEVEERLPAPVGRLTFHKNGALLWLVNGETIFIPTSEEPHRKFFATHVVNSTVDENADPAPFEDFVAEIVDDKETAEYLLQTLATVIGLGRNPFRKAIFCLGGGRNGKSSLFEILRTALGEKLVVSIPPHVIVKSKNGDNISMSAKYKMKGSAIVYTDETPLDNIEEESFKALTGSDTIVVKRLFHDVETIPVTFILCVLSNTIPQSFKSQSHALAERIVCVKFPIRFVDDVVVETKAVKRRDESKVLALKENTAAVIAALRKHFKLAAEKRFILPLPQKVKEMTEPVLVAANAISYFLVSCVEEKADAYIRAKDLYEAYKLFCKQNEVRAVSYKQFTSQLRLLNYTINKMRDGLAVEGIQLKEDTIIPPDGGVDEDEEEAPTFVFDENNDEVENEVEDSDESNFMDIL